MQNALKSYRRQTKQKTIKKTMLAEGNIRTLKGFYRFLCGFVWICMDYITPGNQIETPPNTLQNLSKNTPKYPPNPPPNTLCSRFFGPETVIVVKMCWFCIHKFGFKHSGPTLEFRFLVDIGRSGVMIGRLCLNIVAAGGGRSGVA